MRVTRFAHSCLLVEAGGHRLLIDPGTVTGARFAIEELGDVDAVLYTHRHADHLDPDWVDPLRAGGATLFGNADVVELLGPDRVTSVEPGTTFEPVPGVPVTAHELPHVPMVDGSPGPPNTGYVLDGRLFHPGDGVEISGLRVPAVAAPISGPSISFRDAYRLIEGLGATTVIPIHHEVFAADPAHFARVCDVAEVVLVPDGEPVEI